MKRTGLRRYEKIGLVALLFWLTLAVLGIVGWCLNIADLIGMSDALSTGIGIVRVVGIFIPPLGSFMGWFF
jgi:hypothetical protein